VPTTSFLGSITCNQGRETEERRGTVKMSKAPFTLESFLRKLPPKVRSLWYVARHKVHTGQSRDFRLSKVTFERNFPVQCERGIRLTVRRRGKSFDVAEHVSTTVGRVDLHRVLGVGHETFNVHPDRR